jgi:hypothetical protein
MLQWHNLQAAADLSAAFWTHTNVSSHLLLYLRLLSQEAFHLFDNMAMVVAK